MRLVLGCGNADRGDDAAGCLVAARLRALGVAAHVHSGDALALLDSWRGADEVIVVDAVVTGKRPGTVSIWDALTEPLPGQARFNLSHGFGLAEAITLGRMLGNLPRVVTLYGIEAGRFELGTSPRKAILQAVERVARQIYRSQAAALTRVD